MGLSQPLAPSSRAHGEARSPAAVAAAGGSVLAGLIGSGIQASRTPSLHEREGAEQGLRYIYKIIDIAADWGFPTASHFSRAFRKEFGYSPRELRRGLRQDDG